MPTGCDSFARLCSLRIRGVYGPTDPQRTERGRAEAQLRFGVRYPPKIPGNPQVVPLYFHIGKRRYFSQPKAEAVKAAEGRSRTAEAGSSGRKKLCGQDLSRSGGVERHRSKRSESDRL